VEAGLWIALEQRQFVLHYQPQVAADGAVLGVEALVRWHHPVRGLVPPGEFIPLAEECGLILPLGRWVLEAACAQLAAWADDPWRSRLVIAVNVSARQFLHEDFVAGVVAALECSGADPGRLDLELTESSLVTDVDKVSEKMEALKALGVGFSLDDFGTGYSSLAYLKRLPLDQLKIDRSFVRDILVDPNDAAIARMIIVLADNLGLRVIAEGVECEEQRDFLARNGCSTYQGYLFSAPQPIDALEAFLDARRSRPAR
ncbi:MAG TPA: EAL domain-containing protein, partial [Thauera aminoaromatica]|nr:EAL domain-containing protein [Thauera aminoaromatica]